jgi:WD repeat-containing protein 76
MPVKKEPGAISAFERKRLENIEANRAVLTDISATAKQIIPEKPAPKPSTRKSRRSEPIKREPARPTRTSSRLAGLDADNDTLKRKFEVEAEAQAATEKAKKMRVSGDLNLGDIVVEGKKWGSGIDGIKGIIRGAQPGVKTFTEDDVKETTSQELKDIRLRINGLKLYEHWEPNGTQNDHGLLGIAY